MSDQEPQRLVPTPKSKHELLALIRELHDRVEAGDCLEGSLTWLLPEPGVHPFNAEYVVEARYRTGELAGQHGFEVVGDWVDKSGAVMRHVDPFRKPAK